MHPNIYQITPVSQPTWAVFTKPDGTPEFRALVGFGIIDVNPKEDIRVVMGYATEGEHLEPCDMQKFHVGYTSTPDAEEWRERCRKKLDFIARKESEAKAAKILVPEKKVVQPFE